jgi:pimeloyl-ACP methyl ester carboxylesterase
MPRRRRIRGHRDAAGALWSTLELPGLPSRRSASDVAHEVVGGVPATVVRPARDRGGPSVVFVNGATPHGRAHPTVLRLGRALASCGYRVVIPELPGIAAGELAVSTVAATVSVAAATSGTHDVRLALAGVSVGASVALLAAADEALAARVSTVVCIAPFAHLAHVAHLATTGATSGASGPRQYPVPAALLVGLARSLVLQLPAGGPRERLYRALCTLDTTTADPIASLPTALFRDAGAEAIALGELLRNREPTRFGPLYAELSTGLRSAIELLSPLRVASEIQASVEIATAPVDRYFPVEEAMALVRTIPRARLTITSLLAHATPSLSLRYLLEIGRLERFFARACTNARSPVPLPGVGFDSLTV